MKPLAVAVLLCAFSSALNAQTVFSVRGTVTNESGRPLEQAQVTLDPQGANRQVRTDRDGRFSFVGVPPGMHTLRVAWVGFTPETREFGVTGGDVTVDVILVRITRLVARRGATLRDFSPEDVEAVEFYGETWRNIIESPGRAVAQMDPSGSLRDRWPPRTPCGLPLSPGEEKASKSNVKVMFAVVWLRK